MAIAKNYWSIDLHLKTWWSAMAIIDCKICLPNCIINRFKRNQLICVVRCTKARVVPNLNWVQTRAKQSSTIIRTFRAVSMCFTSIWILISMMQPKWVKDQDKSVIRSFNLDARYLKTAEFFLPKILPCIEMCNFKANYSWLWSNINGIQNLQNLSHEKREDDSCSRRENMV